MSGAPKECLWETFFLAGVADAPRTGKGEGMLWNVCAETDWSSTWPTVDSALGQLLSIA